MKIKFVPCFVLLICLSIIPISSPASAATKFPTLDQSRSFPLLDATDAIGFSRLKENWIVAGVDSHNRNWLSAISAKGEELWRIFPINVGQGGDGFITALTVDSQGVILAGISQNEITVDQSATPEASATASPVISAAPTPTPTRSVPLVNPDSVVVEPDKPFRKDIKNIFVLRVDGAGKITKALNAPNNSGFIPNAIVSNSVNIYVVGNQVELNSQVNQSNQSKGVLYTFSDSQLINTFLYGSKQTIFNHLILTSATSLTIVGSSADTLNGRKVVGKADGLVLTINPATGKIIKIVRSSAKGATRSWDFANGNLLLSGTSVVGKIREGVVTSFAPNGSVSWTTRLPKSSKALASGNCVAYMTTNSDVFLYVVDAKGKQLKGVEIPGQDLKAVATTTAKGCAVLTEALNGEFRVSNFQ